MGRIKYNAEHRDYVINLTHPRRPGRTTREIQAGFKQQFDFTITSSAIGRILRQHEKKLEAEHKRLKEFLESHADEYYWNFVEYPTTPVISGRGSRTWKYTECIGAKLM